MKRVIRIILVAAITWFVLTAIVGCVPKIEAKTPDWEACSENFGDHVCDFKLVDQQGGEVNLYDHYGKVIILDFSVMWCGPCQIAAKDVDALVEKFGSENVVYITVLIEDQYGNDPDLKDLELWSKTFGIESPVLGASRDFLNTTGYNITGWPTFYFIDQNIILKDQMVGYSSVVLESKVHEILRSADTGL